MNKASHFFMYIVKVSTVSIMYCTFSRRFHLTFDVSVSFILKCFNETIRKNNLIF